MVFCADIILKILVCALLLRENIYAMDYSWAQVSLEILIILWKRMFPYPSCDGLNVKLSQVIFLFFLEKKIKKKKGLKMILQGMI